MANTNRSTYQVKCKDGGGEDSMRWQWRKVSAAGFCAGTVPAAKVKRAKKIPRVTKGNQPGDFAGYIVIS